MKMMTKSLLTATALITLPSMAQATVVVQNVSIAVPATVNGVYINVVTGVFSTAPAAVSGWDLNPWGSGSLFFYANNSASPSDGIVVTTSGGATPVDLAAGAVISASSFFGRTTNAVGTSFLTSGSHIFGFRFLNEGTGLVNYGYALITTTTGVTGRPATITQLVYENTGAALTVGATSPAVPEPASWAMMIGGLGLIGTAMRRRSAKVSFA